MNTFAYVGGRIRALREGYRYGAGITQTELGKALQVPRNTISRWESAVYRPDLEDLVRLAGFFGVPVASFFPPETILPGDPMAPEEAIAALMAIARTLTPNELAAVLAYARSRSTPARQEAHP